MTDQLTADRHDAVLFDLDGVITDTAAVRARAWRTVFGELLRQRAEKRHAVACDRAESLA